MIFVYILQEDSFTRTLELLLGHFVIIFLFAKSHMQKMHRKYRRIFNEHITRCIMRNVFYSFVCRLSRKMFSIEDRYYKINRICLKVLGIWPYQNSKWTYVHTSVIRSIYLSGIFVQVILCFSFIFGYI